MCSSDVRSHRMFQSLEVVKWYIDKLNEKNTVPGYKIGFFIVDDCAREQVALARSMQFIRNTQTVCADDRLSTDAPDGGYHDELIHYPVVTVLSASDSQSTISSASLLSVFQMPIIAVSATSEELNNKDKYQYFERTVASDNNQAKAIVQILVDNGWKYTALIHSPDSYGTLGAQSVKRIARDYNICLAFEYSINRENGFKDYARAAEMINNQDNITAIVLFTGDADSHKLMEELIKIENIDKKKLIFIASDGVNSMDMAKYYSLAIDSFFIELDSKAAEPGFYEYFKGISADNNPNDWIQLLFEKNYNCSFNKKASFPNSCLGKNYTMGGIKDYEDWDGVSLYTDAIEVIVKSIAAYIKNETDFPVKSNYTDIGRFRKEVYESFKPLKLLKYIRHIKKKILSLKYKITQLQYNYEASTLENPRLFSRDVGFWFIDNDTLALNRKNIVWSTNNTLFRLLDNETDVIPPSVCSAKCKPDEYMDRILSSCCWQCRGCEKDKIIMDKDNSTPTYCSNCNLTYWPDIATKRYCIRIKPIYIEWNSTISICVCAAGCIGLVFVSCTLAYFWIKRTVKLMKATDIELSIIGLVGVLICYPSAYLHVIPPSDFVCYTASITLHLGFTITYSSLLVVVILFVTIIIWSPIAYPYQRVRSYKRVEFMCQSHLPNFLTPIAYNMILLCLCSVYAFKTRKYPANFNESKLIFLHVLATSFLWLAFIPSYLASNDSISRATLLSMLLLIGATLSTLCLHAPKIYAVIYITEKDMHISQRSFTSRTSSSVVSRYNNHASTKNCQSTSNTLSTSNSLSTSTSFSTTNSSSTSFEITNTVDTVNT